MNLPKPIVNKYSINDTDLEHLTRSNRILPPRIIRPQILAVYGLNMTLLRLIISFIKNQTKNKKHYYTGIKGAGYKMLESVNTDKLTGKKRKKKDLRYGKIIWEIDTSVGAKKEKKIMQYRDMPEKWRIMWDLLFFNFLNEYLEGIYPKHLHFILKDSIVTPLPFDYIDFFLKAETANMGNICADFAEGDTINESKYD